MFTNSSRPNTINYTRLQDDNLPTIILIHGTSLYIIIVLLDVL